MPLSGYKSTKVIVTLGASLGETSERGRVLLILPRVGKKRYSLSQSIVIGGFSSSDTKKLQGDFP